MKIRKRKMTVMPAMKALPEQLQPKEMKWSYVSKQAKVTDEWKVAPGIARRYYEPRGTKVSDELVAEAERTKSTIYWLPDDATNKSWNLEGQYLAAGIVFRTPKEAEFYGKGRTLALKKRKMKEQQQKEREVRKARKAEAAVEPAAPPAPAADQGKPEEQTDNVSAGAGASAAAPDGAEGN